MQAKVNIKRSLFISIGCFWLFIIFSCESKSFEPRFFTRKKKVVQNRDTPIRSYGNTGIHSLIVECNRIKSRLKSQSGWDFRRIHPNLHQDEQLTGFGAISLDFHTLFAENYMGFISLIERDTAPLVITTAGREYLKYLQNMDIALHLRLPSWLPSSLAGGKKRDDSSGFAQWNQKIIGVLKSESFFSRSSTIEIEISTDLVSRWEDRSPVGSSFASSSYPSHTSSLNKESVFKGFKDLAEGVRNLFPLKSIGGPGLIAGTDSFYSDMVDFAAFFQLGRKKSLLDWISWQDYSNWPSAHQKNVEWLRQLNYGKEMKVPFVVSGWGLRDYELQSEYLTASYLAGTFSRYCSGGIRNFYLALPRYQSDKKTLVIRSLVRLMGRIVKEYPLILKVANGNDLGRSLLAVMSQRRDKILILISDMKSRSRQFSLQLKKLPITQSQKGWLSHKVMGKRYGIWKIFSEKECPGSFIKHDFINSSPMIHLIEWKKRR